MPTQTYAAAFDQIHEQAIASTGLDDFGDISYHEGLRVLLNAQDQRACREGEAAAILSQLSRTLGGRLQAIAAIKARPDSQSVAIVAPLVILGLPRTGTTALHHLLMRDPQFQGLQYWIGRTPMVRPARESWPDLPQYLAAEAEIEAMHEAIPALKAIHRVEPDEVEECRMIMEHNFASTALSASWDIPAYSDWLYAQDLIPHYRYYANVLRLIGSDTPALTWLLKCPHHMLAIDSLLAVFPDARLVFTHRDPVDVVPSICSLNATFHRYPSDAVEERETCGTRHTDNLDYVLRRAMAVRDQHPDRFFDLRFIDFRRDPIGSVKRIYERFDLHLSDAALMAMTAWNDENAKASSAPGGHRYAPEDFGISISALKERFSYYDSY